MALITPENAAKLQAKSRQSIREKKAAMQAELARLNDLAMLPAPADVMPDYPKLVLTRVRLQLDLINERLTEQLVKGSPDPQAIDRLANAQMRLAEQERILAGRPLPGSRKPAPDRPNHRRLAPQPQPVVEEQPRLNDPNEPNG